MRAAALVLLVTVAGCTGIEVQDMGHGQHSLRASSDSGGYYGSYEAAVEQADAYCAHRGQQADIDGFFDHPALGPNGEHESSVIFRCTRRPPLHF